MKYTVAVLRRAREDADRVFNWIVTRSPQGAVNWGRAYDAAVSQLAVDAQHGLAPENADVEIELRQKIFKTRRGRKYRLLFTIVGREVRILRVRGPGQAFVTRNEISE